MMKILSINKTLHHKHLSITNVEESDLTSLEALTSFEYIIIHGGDGSIRRIVKILHTLEHHATFILNPTGSFNVIAKLHRVPKLDAVLNTLVEGNTPKTDTHNYYSLNKEVFLFSAGNMGDLQHIFLSETLRFGILKNGIAKYLLAGFFLFPVHLVMTPFMLFSPRRFFILTPAKFITKFGSFYGKVAKEIVIDLENGYNMIELDGDVVTVEESVLTIKPAGELTIVI